MKLDSNYLLPRLVANFPSHKKVIVVDKQEGSPTIEDGAIQLNSPMVVIGRSKKGSTCDIRLKDTSASEIHCMLVDTVNRGIWIKDLGSLNGTRVNDLKVESKKLALGDEIRIGNLRFTLDRKTGKLKHEIDVTGARDTALPKSPKIYPSCDMELNTSGLIAVEDISIKPGQMISIGSSEKSDITISPWGISGKHMTFFLKEDGSAAVKDCGSRFGTYVNGEKLEPGIFYRLEEGDEVAFSKEGNVAFTIGFAPKG